MIRIGICDDENFMLDMLENQITDFFSRSHREAAIHRFTNGNALLKSPQALDLIFLDIRMGEPDGLKTGKALREQGFRGFLIYVTVFRDYVFDAFETQPFDYLVKPLQKEQFDRTMERLLSSMGGSMESRLLVQKGSEWHILPFDEIIYCEIINRKIYLHTKHNAVIDYYEKLDRLEQKLDQRFFRCHRSYLINLQYLKSYRTDMAWLTDGETVPVSRLRAGAFSAAIVRYMKEGRAY